MFVIELVYKAPLEEIDRHMQAHIKFLTKYYKRGDFIVSGRKVPRTGGIILAAGDDIEAIKKIMDEDPFCKHGLADVSVTEFRASQYQPGLKEVLGL